MQTYVSAFSSQRGMKLRSFGCFRVKQDFKALGKSMDETFCEHIERPVCMIIYAKITKFHNSHCLAQGEKLERPSELLPFLLEFCI